MSYATVQDIASAFNPDQWSPTTEGHEPTSATVETWLTDASDVLDGRVADLVQTPVDQATSPKLYAVCRRVVTLYVRAQVYDVLFPPTPSEPVISRISTVGRTEAEGLVDDMQKGHLADGQRLGGGQAAAAAGAPAALFPAASFTLGDKW